MSAQETRTPVGDLGPSAFKGSHFKPEPSLGGIGNPKPKRTAASPQRKAEIRAKKATACRCCPNPDGLKIHAHHIVRAGAPHFGSWTENNILGLCAACHKDLHDKNARGVKIRKILRVRLTDAEVRYGDDKAYEGFVDDEYWRIRPAVTTGDAA